MSGIRNFKVLESEGFNDENVKTVTSFEQVKFH